jgi:hypothetical protein
LPQPCIFTNGVIMGADIERTSVSRHVPGGERVGPEQCVAAVSAVEPRGRTIKPFGAIRSRLGLNLLENSLFLCEAAQTPCLHTRVRDVLLPLRWQLGRLFAFAEEA